MEIEKAEVWGLFRFLPHELPRDPGRRRRPTAGSCPTWRSSTPRTPGTRSTCSSRCSTTTTACCAARSRSTSPTTAAGRDPSSAGCSRSSPSRPAAPWSPRSSARSWPSRCGWPTPPAPIVRNASAQRELDRDPRGVPGRAGRGLPVPRVVDPDLRRGRRAARARSTPPTGGQVELPADLVELAERAARRSWADQTAVVVAGDHPVPPGLTADEHRSDRRLPRHHRRRLDALRPARRRWRVPRQPGAHPRAGEPEWTELDRRAALDIGHDLGRVILNARTFEREHELVVELQALDTYKSQLIATISHELKNPLTAITGYLELLETAPELSPTSRSAVAAMDRGADRLSRVVEDLLLLAKVGDPQHGIIAVRRRPGAGRRRGGRPDAVAVTARRKTPHPGRRPAGRTGRWPAVTRPRSTGWCPTSSATR